MSVLPWLVKIRRFHGTIFAAFPRHAVKAETSNIPRFLGQNPKESDERKPSKPDVANPSFSNQSSKDVIKGLIHSAIPQNIVATPTSAPVVRSPSATALDRPVAPSYPAHQFVDERKEIFETKIPQRIMKMKFDQDEVETEFESCLSLLQWRSLVRSYLPIMDHVNFLDALQSCLRIVAADQITSQEILDTPEFVVVVKGLVKYGRDFTHDEFLDVLGGILDLGVPVSSLPVFFHLELLKTHVNKLDIRQLIRLLRSLTAAIQRQDQDALNSASEDDDLPSKRLTASLMGVETLILLRFEEERSWLEPDDLVDLLAFLRPSVLTRDIVERCLTTMTARCAELSPGACWTFCQWAAVVGREFALTYPDLDPTFEVVFHVCVSVISEKCNELKLRSKSSMLKTILTAAAHFCETNNVLKWKLELENKVEKDIEEDLTFYHASYELSLLIGMISDYQNFKKVP